MFISKRTAKACGWNPALNLDLKKIKIWEAAIKSSSLNGRAIKEKITGH